METIDLENYGNLPRHVRQSLATADVQPSTEPKEENIVPEDSENQSQDNVIEQTEEQQVEAPNATPENHQEHNAEDNEAKSWKGRLSKEQEEHKATKNRYLAEVEARQKAEQQAKEYREKLEALESKAKANKQQPVEQKPQQSEENIFSDEDLNEIGIMVGGTAGEKLIRFIKSQQGKQQTSVPQIDVNKVIDERFNQERQRNEEQAREEAFGRAIREQAPSLQGLLNDSAFIEFANNEVIDYMGNTASSMLNFIGQNKRADLVPQIAKLIEKFEQSRQPQQQQVTAAPSNKGPAVNTRSAGKKPKPSPATIEKMQRLMRSGNVDELRALQEKYDLN